MTRLNLVLLAAVVASALYLVRSQYESRQLFSELDRATAETRRLELERERLEVEKRAQATPLRVEKLAKDQLQMRPASPGITQYASLPASAGAPERPSRQASQAASATEARR